MKKIKNYLDIYSSIFNYEESKCYTDILKKCIDSGVRCVTYDSINSGFYYYINVTFNNGVTAKLWNQNYPYAWLNRGVFKILDKEVEFEKLRPSKRQMARLRCAIGNRLNDVKKEDPLCKLVDKL